MKILLVDDEINVLRALKQSLDWKKLGITEVFTALSAEAARKILTENAVDIVVTDVEMPRESGLELLTWIRETGLEAQVILLTGYADFNYAQTAIKLGVIDYCLKPVVFTEFEKVLDKAVQAATKTMSEADTASEKQIWEQSRRLAADSFWRQTMEEDPEEAGDLFADAEKIGLEIGINASFSLYIISAKFAALRHGTEEAGRMLKGICDAYIGADCRDPYYSTAFVNSPHTCILMTLENEQEDQPAPDILLQQAESWDREIFGLYIHHVYPEELRDACRRLMEAEKKEIAFIPGIRSVRGSECTGKEDGVEENGPDRIPRRIEELLYRGELERFEEEIRGFLHEKSRMVTSAGLRQYRADICQMFNVCLKANGVASGSFFTDDAQWKLLDEAVLSVDHMMLLVKALLGMLSTSDAQHNSVTEMVCRYIEARAYDDISREQIAAALHLSDDYVSRVFNQEMGMSVPQYINRIRIDRAKQLIVMPGRTISEVAAEVGYTNFSYFCRIFRQLEGCAPRDFRRRNQTGQ